MSAAANVKTRRERQDELVELVLRILRPQLDGQMMVSPGQHRELQEAIAHFANEVRAEYSAGRAE